MIDALKFCEKLIKSGFDIFVNPMNTINYSAVELFELVQKINSINPKVFTIVDTIGKMNKKDTLSLFYFVDKNINPEISIGFHSHNNLQLSFSNVQALLECKTNRNIIIDSTLFGIGRGAGNLQTELITQYLNENYDANYDTIPILKVIQEQINPIFACSPWGYSVPYRLAALNSCHPDYVKYLIEKHVCVDIIDSVLKKIPSEFRSNFNIDEINKINIS